MTKKLLSLAGAMAIASASAFAFAPVQGPVAANNDAPAAVNGSRAATSDGYEIKFCGSPSSAYTMGAAEAYRCYLYITPEVATQLAGNQLTKISLAPALLVSGSLDGYIFVSEDIAAEPLTSTNVTFTNSYVSSTQALNFQTHSLETPYEIKENTGFYFGYVINDVKSSGNSGDYVIGIDNQTANAFSGYADIIQGGEVVKSVNVGDELGNNLLLAANTVGDKKELKNMLNISSLSMGGFTLPVTDELTNKTVTLKIANLGSNKVSNISYTISVEGGETISADRAISILSTRTGTLNNLKAPDFVPGYGKITFTITKVNGEEIDPVSASSNFIAIDGESYPRKFVVEEGTGTWCGYCPRGIVGFDYMETQYPDEFVGIAVHSGDAMQINTYNPIFNYITGFPGAMVNRDPLFVIDPSSTTLKSNYTKWANQKGAAIVTVSTDAPTENSIKVHTTTTFAYDDANADYSLAFVTLQDGIVGMQTNYYAGGSMGAMGGWEKKGSSVRTEYKHVARNIYDYYGIEGSIPAQVVKGQEMQYSYDVPLENVTDVEKSTVVVLVLDNKSGTILNAAQIHAADYGTTGISEITTDTDANAPVEYYNLQGVRMSNDNLPAGLYITRQGNKTAKVVVK